MIHFESKFLIAGFSRWPADLWTNISRLDDRLTTLIQETQPVPIQPEPRPGPIQPEPILGPIQPEPRPGPIQPEPILGPIQPEPRPGPIQPEPSQITYTSVPEDS